MSKTNIQHDGGEIEIRHTRAEGTLVYGTSKGDGAGDVLKAHRFAWFPSLRVWGIRSSRDKEAQHARIDTVANSLRDAGFNVSVHIDESVRRSVAEIEADKNERASARTERYSKRATSASSRSEQLWHAGGRITAGYQGEPIKIGHHSENRHRRDLDRADGLRRKAIAEDDKTAYYSARADAAGHYQAVRESVPVTLRRLERLEAERRRRQREQVRLTEGSSWWERCDREIRDLDEQITYWTDHVEQVKAADLDLKIWGPDDFDVGDFARVGRSWHEVIRVNTKTLTVASNVRRMPLVHRAGEEFTHPNRVPYDKVSGHASAEEMKSAFAGNDDG